MGTRPGIAALNEEKTSPTEVKKVVNLNILSNTIYKLTTVQLGQRFRLCDRPLQRSPDWALAIHVKFSTLLQAKYKGLIPWRHITLPTNKFARFARHRRSWSRTSYGRLYTPNTLERKPNQCQWYNVVDPEDCKQDWCYGFGSLCIHHSLHFIGNST